MNFSKEIPIYLQIENIILENILSKKWQTNDRIPSVREFAASLEVNPNTVQRTFSRLQEYGILENRRGVGYFVSDTALSMVQKIVRKQIFEEQIPKLFKSMKLLNIDKKELVEFIEKNY